MFRRVQEGLLGVAGNVLFLDLSGSFMVLGDSIQQDVISPQIDL